MRPSALEPLSCVILSLCITGTRTSLLKQRAAAAAARVWRFVGVADSLLVTRPAKQGHSLSRARAAAPLQIFGKNMKMMMNLGSTRLSGGRAGEDAAAPSPTSLPTARKNVLRRNAALRPTSPRRMMNGGPPDRSSWGARWMLGRLVFLSLVCAARPTSICGHTPSICDGTFTGTELNLRNQGLTGTIPIELFQYTQLTGLWLSTAISSPAPSLPRWAASRSSPPDPPQQSDLRHRPYRDGPPHAT